MSPHPTPETIRSAWQQVRALPEGEPGPDRARCLDVLLDGLPLVADGKVEADGQALSLAQIPARAAIPELARRLLALGWLDGPYPSESSLLHPHRAAIDPTCTDPSLAFARAVTAVELHDAALLAVVVGRHLGTRPAEAANGRSVLDWLRPLLEDDIAQCLLTAALAGTTGGCECGELTVLARGLVREYEEARERQSVAADWPAGPLTACCALGALFRRPGEVALLAEFRDHVEVWAGWRDADAWATRPPVGGPGDVQARVTERLATALGVGGRRLWPRGRVAPALEGCWPPLLSFCFAASAAPPRPAP